MNRRLPTRSRTRSAANVMFGALALLLLGCGGGGGAVLFAGTCLEPLYKCFTTTGTGTCSYVQRIMQASLVFPNGAKVTSTSGGADDNQCFGPAGPPVCLTVTRGNDGTTFSVRGKNQATGEQISATVIDDSSGMLQVQCPNQDNKLVPKPAQNPSFEDLRRCVTP